MSTLHISIFKEGPAILDAFNLQPCPGCTSGCNGGYSSFHCPICPVGKFKPTRKIRTTEHLKQHFYGSKGVVCFNGYRVTGCTQDCGYETKRSRTHFHCPFCGKTLTKKQDYLRHVERCSGATVEVSESQDSTDLAETLETTENLESRIAPELTEPDFTDTHTEDTEQTHVSDRPTEITITEPQDTTENAERTDVTENDNNEIRDEEREDTVEATQIPLVVNSNSRECHMCHKKYHKKYLRAHIRLKHTENCPQIHEGRHHHSASVDRDLGIFTVSRTMRGVLHPIHVIHRTIGNDHLSQCELSECQDNCQMEWRTGNSFYLCDHLKSVEFAVNGVTCELYPDKLCEMTYTGFMSSDRKQSCEGAIELATKANSPALNSVPFMAYASNRYQFFSVYTDIVRWWCKLKRTIVTVDTQNSWILCRCRQKGCVHRGLVRLWLFQQGRKDIGLTEIDGDINDDGDVSDRYPPTGDMLRKMISYLINNKKITDDRLKLPAFSKDRCTKQLIPHETECLECKCPLGEPQLITRRAKVVSFEEAPIEDFETFYKVCPQCQMPYRYQETSDGIFNYDDRTLATHSLLLKIRRGLVTHSAISRVVGLIEYSEDVTFKHSDIEHAYLAFEALTDHGYEFFCMRCGHHPKILIHDLTKKAVFRYAVNDVPVPESPTPQVNADEFWCGITTEIVAGCLLREYAKIHSTDPEQHEPIPEEIITHLLGDEKLDTVRRFCRVLGLKAQGSKLDMLCRMRSQSVTKANFNHAYAALYGHSGGWLSSTCPHNVTYAVKFLLRSESPRDYVDILRSLKHVPTVNIADIANMIAKIGNKLVPGMFHPNEGRVAATTPENIAAAKSGRMCVKMPWLSDDRPKKPTSTAMHPITGSVEKFMLFDWFHEENCSVEEEVLRRSTLVREIAGTTNTQAAEQLHRDKARDLYWINEMKPTNHIFAFRLMTHLKNLSVNQKALVRHQKAGKEITLNSLGQFIRNIGLPETFKSVTLPATVTCNVVPPIPTTSANSSDDETFIVSGIRYQRHRVSGDGNCLFRAVCVSVPDKDEIEHSVLRQDVSDWCIANRTVHDISEEELLEISTPGTAVGEVAVIAIANLLNIGIVIVFKTKTSIEHQPIRPVMDNPVSMYPILFDLGGHYDALVTDKIAPVCNQNVAAENTLKRKRPFAATQSQKQKKNTPVQFTDLPLHDRQRRVLSWLVSDEDVELALTGTILQETCVETRPECVSVCILDSNVDISDVRSMFSDDAWAVVTSTILSKRHTAVWICTICQTPILEGVKTIVCESCLSWLHMSCAGLKRSPKAKVWFCGHCK